MYKVIIIIAMLILSGLFSGCETAFSCVNKIRLKNYAAQGNKRAEKALKMANSFDDALTAILIGNNIVNILSASISTILFTELIGSGGVGVATAVMTLLVLIFGEITPKSYAKCHAESVALTMAGPLWVLIKIMTPVVYFFKFIQNAIKPEEEQPTVTEDELKYMIEEIEEQGVLEEQESDLVRSALEFDEITVDEILIPRVKVVAVERNESFEKIKDIFLEEMYSRIPVYEKSIDNIIGIITQKSFFRLVTEGKEDIEGIIQEVIHLSDLKPISEALKEMQKNKMHMAIVLDQYGGTKGIITMEDIIEELVGEIYDENDEVVNNFIKTGENEYEIAGELTINDMLEKLELPEDEIESSANTVGGWVMELLGHIAAEGETAESGAFKLTVISAEENKVIKVKLSVSTVDDNEEEQEE